jgi:tRNA-dihydrouridine synthase
MYRLPVHYDFIRRAAEVMPCPVMANGHVYSADQALEVLDRTKARGLMIGRGAIRNPWLFEQIRQRLRGEPVRLPTGREVLAYVTSLWETVCTSDVSELQQAQRLKKFMNYLAEGVDVQFLHDIRRVTTMAEFFRVCETWLDHDKELALEPFEEHPNPNIQHPEKIQAPTSKPMAA